MLLGVRTDEDWIGSGDFVNHQYANYLLISNTDPATGHGIQDVYRTYWTAFFVQSWLIAFTQVATLVYFTSRAYVVRSRSLAKGEGYC